MKVAVAGSGIGGLITGLLLAKNGHSVTIFEKEKDIGGRLAFVTKGDYKIDKGPTIVLLPDMLMSILADAGVNTEEIELIRCDPLYGIHFPDGQTYRKFADLETQMDEIRREFPGDEEGFKRFMADMDERFAIGEPQFLQSSFLGIKDYMNPKTISSLIKLKAYRTVMSNLRTYFSHERLQMSYGLQSLYIGGNPYSTPAIYSLVSFSEHKHGIYYIKGGYASILEPVRKACERLGVEIKTSCPVEKILVKDGKAKGIRSDEGDFLADAVVVNGDFPGTHSLMERPSDKKYKPSSGCVLFYMGVKGTYPDKDLHQFYLNEHFSKNMKEIFEKGKVPSEPSFYVFNPSIVDESLAPEGNSVLYVLVPVPASEKIDWEDASGYLSSYILDTMEESGFDDLRGRLNWMETRTPDQARQEGLYAGGSFGIAPALGQSGPFRPQVQPFPEKNVFAVGASTHPGGGVPIVMQGAKLVEQAVQRYFEEELERKDVTMDEQDFGSIRSL